MGAIEKFVAPVRAPLFGPPDELGSDDNVVRFPSPAQPQPKAPRRSAEATLEIQLLGSLVHGHAHVDLASAVDAGSLSIPGGETALNAIREASPGTRGNAILARMERAGVAPATIEAIEGADYALEPEEVARLAGEVVQGAFVRLVAAAGPVLAAGAEDEAVRAKVKELLERNPGTVDDAFTDTEDAAEETMADFRARRAGLVRIVSTGFKDLDLALGGGLPEASMNVLAAPTGLGKTTLATQIYEHVARTFPDEIVVVISLEMPRKQLIRKRIELASEGRLSVKAQLNPIGFDLSDDDAALLEHLAAGLPRNVKILDSTILGVEAMAARIRALHAKRRVALVVVDYLQLLDGPDADTRQEVVSGISRSLKRLAVALESPVLALAQLNREAGKQDGPPQLSHLRESGSIEQDSDVVLFIHTDEGERLRPDVPKHCATIKIAKDRNGARDVLVDIVFDRQKLRYETMGADAPAPVLTETAKAAAAVKAGTAQGRGKGKAAKGVEAGRVQAHAEAQRTRQAAQHHAPADGLDLFAL
jgi:replicative DNA helicase